MIIGISNIPDDFSRLAAVKIDFLVKQGGTVSAIVIDDPVKGKATVDKFGKVTWRQDETINKKGRVVK